MVLSLVLTAAIFGRVTAMWIASEMSKTLDPILHAVVTDRSEAARHAEEILALPGLVVELGGQVIVLGRAIKRRNPWLSRARYIGLLAAPFDITKMAVSTNTNTGRGSNDTMGETLVSSISSPPNLTLSDFNSKNHATNDIV